MDIQMCCAPQNLTVSAGSEQCEMEKNINYNGNDDKMPDGKLCYCKKFDSRRGQQDGSVSVWEHQLPLQ